MAFVTPHMLRKKLSEVQKQAQTGVRGISSSSTTTEDNMVQLTLAEKEIDRVQNEYMICADGTKAKLYSPIPGVKWRCLAPVGSQGIIALNKPLTGLILSDGENNYCLGVNGDTSDFEILLQIGDSEVRITELFVNIKSKLLVKNGVEDTTI